MLKSAQKLRRIAFFLGIAILIFLAALSFIKAPIGKKSISSEEALQELGLSSQKLQEFSVEQYLFNEQEGSVKVTLQNSQDILKIESTSSIDKVSADILLNDKIVTIRALYGAALSPYPGEISNKIVCNNKFMPKFNARQSQWANYSYFVLFATDRLTYGACSEDLLKYKAILAWAYCEEKNTFYQFELFSPIANVSEPRLGLITSLLRC